MPLTLTAEQNQRVAQKTQLVTDILPLLRDPTVTLEECAGRIKDIFLEYESEILREDRQAFDKISSRSGYEFKRFIQDVLQQCRYILYLPKDILDELLDVKNLGDNRPAWMLRYYASSDIAMLEKESDQTIRAFHELSTAGLLNEEDTKRSQKALHDMVLDHYAQAISRLYFANKTQDRSLLESENLAFLEYYEKANKSLVYNILQMDSNQEDTLNYFYLREFKENPQKMELLLTIISQHSFINLHPWVFLDTLPRVLDSITPTQGAAAAALAIPQQEDELKTTVEDIIKTLTHSDGIKLKIDALERNKTYPLLSDNIDALKALQSKYHQHTELGGYVDLQISLLAFHGPFDKKGLSVITQRSKKAEMAILKFYADKGDTLAMSVYGKEKFNNHGKLFGFSFSSDQIEGAQYLQNVFLCSRHEGGGMVNQLIDLGLAKHLDLPAIKDHCETYLETYSKLSHQPQHELSDKSQYDLVEFFRNEKILTEILRKINKHITKTAASGAKKESPDLRDPEQPHPSLSPGLGEASEASPLLPAAARGKRP